MYGVPEDYKVYMYTAFGMILAGVVAFVVFLIIGIAALVSASVIAIGCGFTIVAVMGFAFLRKKKKDINADFNITILIRILLLLAFAVSTYLIVFAGFYVETDPFSTNMLITLTIALPIVIISLITCDLFLNRKRSN
jgi:FtsH-binding integral membrane protein